MQVTATDRDLPILPISINQNNLAYFVCHANQKESYATNNGRECFYQLLGVRGRYSWPRLPLMNPNFVRYCL
jgi:hypothetical protein